MPLPAPWLVGGRTRRNLRGGQRLPTDPHVPRATPPHRHVGCAVHQHVGALPPPPASCRPPSQCHPLGVELLSAVVPGAAQDLALAEASPPGAALAAAVPVVPHGALVAEAAADPRADGGAAARALPLALAHGEAPLKVALVVGLAVVTLAAAVGLCCESWTRSVPVPSNPNSAPAS